MPDVTLFLRQIRRRSETDVPKKEQQANQQVARLWRLALRLPFDPFTPLTPLTKNQPHCREASGQHGQVRGVNEAASVVPGSRESYLTNAGMCGNSREHVSVVRLKRRQRITSGFPADE